MQSNTVAVVVEQLETEVLSIWRAKVTPHPAELKLVGSVASLVRRGHWTFHELQTDCREERGESLGCLQHPQV